MANPKLQTNLPNVEQLNACFELLTHREASLLELASVSNASSSELAPVLRELIEQGVLFGSLNPESTIGFSGDVERLSKQSIKQQIAPRYTDILACFALETVIGSTNDRLLKSPIVAGKAGLCLTEMQVAGRGRRGNAWHSGPFRNIAMSVAYKFASWPSSTPSFALAAGVAIASVLRDKVSADVKIKWPNDVLVYGKKLGGILVEAAGAYGGDCLLVVGLGLNVEQRDDSASAGSDYQWASLTDLGLDCSRNDLVAELVSALIETFILFESNGFNPFREHWQNLSAFHDARVLIVNQETSFEGWQRGVDASGALIVEDLNGITHTIDDVATSVRGVNER